MSKITIISCDTRPDIIISENAEDPIVYAAEEFIEFVENMTKTRLSVKNLPVFNDNPVHNDNSAIYLGIIKELIKSKFIADELKSRNLKIDERTLGKEGAYILITKSQKPGDTSNLIITGLTSRSVLYAVYTLFSDIWGCRWYSPECEIYPESESLQLLEDLTLISKPSFDYRMTTFIDAMDPDWATRNRFNINFFAESIHGGKMIDQGKMTHTFYTLIPPKNYFKDHPEYFSLLPDDENMKKFELKSEVDEIEKLASTMQLTRRASGSGGWGGLGQLCLSNKSVLNLVVEKVSEWKENQLEIIGFGVAQNDSATGYCLCPQCMELYKKYGSISGAIIDFTSKVAEKVNERYPDTQIFTLAYTYSETPPKNIKAHPMVVVALCHMRPSCDAHPLDLCEKNHAYIEHLKGWTDVAENVVIWHYVVDFAHYLLPFPNLFSLSKDIKYYHNERVKGILFQGNSSISKGSEFQELKSWVLAQMSWNPDQDLWKLIEEFSEAYYGDASPMIKEWLHYLNNLVSEDNKKCMDLYSGIETGIITREVLNKGWNLINDALNIANTESTMEVYNRVELVSVGLIYADLLILSSEKNKSNKMKADIETHLEEFLRLCEKHSITALSEGGGIEKFVENLKKNS